MFYVSPLSPAFKKLISETNRTSCLEVFCKKSGLRNFAKFTGKHHTCARVSLLIKLQVRPAASLVKRLCDSCFPANFVNFLRTPFLTEHLRWLLLKGSYKLCLLLKCCKCNIQKQPSRGILKKRISENIQQICRRAPMLKCDFNKVAK